ncbi:MAG: putative phosphohydrolase [Planctomycetota bacterium]|nr:putative phosphohydrolase [Planctomycetota bacterium]
MNVWAIADLHLSLARDDPRERFGARWRDHAETIAREWRAVVQRDDLVLLPGDISMARNHREVQPDLAWLDRLPGRKVLSAGNHDAWWNGAAKVRPMLRKSLRAVGGDALDLDGVIVCGTTGAAYLADEPEARAIAAMDREDASLRRALEQAVTLRGTGTAPIFVLWHYPPFDAHRRPAPIVERMEAAGVTACVYGHLHAESQWGLAVQGDVYGVRYYCVAADAVGFRPLKIA